MEKEESFEERLEGSEFDLREAERQLFAEIYAEFLNKYLQCQENSFDLEADVGYLNISKTLINTIKRYAKHDEETYEKAEELEEEMRDKIKVLQNRMADTSSPSFTSDAVSAEKRDEIKDFIEDLRHEANLKIPQKKTTDEDQAWRKSI